MEDRCVHRLKALAQESEVQLENAPRTAKLNELKIVLTFPFPSLFIIEKSHYLPLRSELMKQLRLQHQQSIRLKLEPAIGTMADPPLIKCKKRARIIIKK